MLTPKQIAEQGTFSVKEVGSSVHGTNLEGVDDLDLMGVTFQPPEYLLGLQKFEQFIHRTAIERKRFEAREDQRRHGQEPPSLPGDLDLVVYSIQKYLGLALAGNPSILVFLFSPKPHPEYQTALDKEWANSLDSLASDIVSCRAGIKFLGYARAQKERLLGVRGQMRVTRKDLIDAYGYDTKYAMQVLRLSYQGIEIMRTGKISLPMATAITDELKVVRQGGYLFNQIIDWIDDLDRELKEAIDASELPKHPDYNRVDNWLVNSQLEYFNWRRELESLPSDLRPKVNFP